MSNFTEERTPMSNFLNKAISEIDKILLGVDLTTDEVNLISSINSNAIDFQYYARCADERLNSIKNLTKELKNHILNRYNEKEKK